MSHRIPAVAVRRHRPLLPVVLALSSLLVPAQGRAQEAYYHQLPPAPRIVAANAATTTFGFYTAKRPRGVEARWEPVLRELAERFSPVLRLPNASRSRRIEDALEEGPYGSELTLDSWAAGDAQEVHSLSRRVDVGPLFNQAVDSATWELERCAASETHTARHDAAGELRFLVQCYGPVGRRIEPFDPQARSEDVLYFDFLGEGEADWREDLEDERHREPHAYVHPFVERVHHAALGDEPMYRLVLQYWYFYPFNDFVNNHEGDWEHINVHVGTRGSVGLTGPERGLLKEDEISALDRGLLDDIVITRLDYYFHHHVVELDLVDLGVYSEACDPAANRFPKTREGRRTTRGAVATGWEHAARVLCQRHGGAEGSTHPVAYAAGTPLEWTRLFSLPGVRDRNGHGNYPFLGVWKRVGPLNVNELVDHEGDEDRATEVLAALDECLPKGGCGLSKNWVAFDRSRLTLIPDWDPFFGRCDGDEPNACTCRPPTKEVAGSPGVERHCFHTSGSRWFWLYLPIRWGYPVTPSPGSGLIPRYNVGQAAPMGPAFQGGWNRTGASPGFPLYRPHIRDAGVLALTDLYWKEGGFLNHVVQATALVPAPFLPLAFILGVQNPPMFTPQPNAPDRGLSFSVGGHLDGASAEISALVSPDPSIGPEAAEPQRQSQWWLHVVERYHLAGRYHIGRFTSGIAFDREVTDARVEIRDAGVTTAEIERLGLMGFLRASTSHGYFQPFAQLGYGWSRWAIEDVRTDPAAPGNVRPLGGTSDWVSWVPEDLTLGVGIEVVRLDLPLRVHPFGKDGWDWGIEVAYDSHWTRVGEHGELGLAFDPGTVRRDRLRLSLTVGR